MSQEKLSNPSVLSFERKLDPSDALFYSGNWNDRASLSGWKPLEIREKSVRGTKASREEKKTEEANLQKVDVATLNHDNDTLKVSFTLRVLGNLGQAATCNKVDYQKKLKTIVGDYKVEFGFKKLGLCYAENLATGRFLWRNRVGAESVEVKVESIVKGISQASWTFDIDNINQSQLDALANVMAKGFSGNDRDHTLLDVTAFVRIGDGQEVFPSQELILDKGTGKGGKSKTLYQVSGIAAMHSQKIGNALRTIDVWYPENALENLGAIAIEPYGAVTTCGKAYRQPKEKSDFYTLFDDWLLKDRKPNEESQHYVIANLIRGGVFSDAKGDKNPDKKKAKKEEDEVAEDYVE